MIREDNELVGWEHEGATFIDDQADAPVARGGAEHERSPSVTLSTGEVAEPRRRRSLRDIAPVQGCRLLKPFDRAEVADEMYER